VQLTSRKLEPNQTILQLTHCFERSHLLPTPSAKRRPPIRNPHAQWPSHTISKEHSTRYIHQRWRRSCTNAGCPYTSPTGLLPSTLLEKWHLDLIGNQNRHSRTTVAYLRDPQSRQSSFSFTVIQCSKKRTILPMLSTPPMWTISLWYSCHRQYRKPIDTLKNEPNDICKRAYHFNLPFRCPRLICSTVSLLPVRTRRRVFHPSLHFEYMARRSAPIVRSNSSEYLLMNHSLSNTMPQWQLPEETRFSEA